MADSTITKKALAAALKQLMEEMPFDKIRIANICERCNMNRKSFYYHFEDKYELLNWIFDTEIISFAKGASEARAVDQQVEGLRAFCGYFYDNRDFYRKALKIQGQNSFAEHFREYIMPLMQVRLRDMIGTDIGDFESNFFTDAMVCAIVRWLLDKNCMPPDVFVDKLVRLVQRSVQALHNELNCGK